MSRLEKKDCVVGQQLHYTSFGTTDYAVIEVVGKPSKITKDGTYTFDAKIIDNSHWSVADKYEWSKIGAIKKFNNCFVSKSYNEMVGDVEDYKKVMIGAVKKMYENETGKKFTG